MWTFRCIVFGASVLALASCNEAPPASLEGVADAMGATDLTSISYSGTGSSFGFGQAFLPGEAWPRFNAPAYNVAVNYETPAMVFDTTRSQGENPPHGGAGQPIAGEQRTMQIVSGTNAWNENGDTFTPANAAAADRLRALWATPHGVIKAAMANGGTLEGNTIKFRAQDRDYTATLDGENLVTKVEYLSTNEVVGDYPIVITYSDYADHDGVKFPGHIVQTEDGFATWDIMVSEVTPNAEVALVVPENVSAAPPPPPVTARSEVLAPGVWYINAAGAWNWAVDMGDHAVVIEAITSEARSLAVIDEVRRLMPDKEIRYLVNTHAHYDHAGGLRTYVALGSTIVTWDPLESTCRHASLSIL